MQGLVSTGNCLSVAPVAEEVRQLFMSWDGTTQNGVKDTMPDAKYVFKSTDNECEAVMASLLAVKYYKGKFKKIAGLNPDYSYGKNNWEAFKQILTRYGIEFEVVADHWVKVGFSPADLAPHIDALKKAKPDLIYSSILFADQGTLMKAAHTAGLTKHTKFVLPGGPVGYQRAQEGNSAGKNHSRLEYALLRLFESLAAAKGIRALLFRSIQDRAIFGGRPRLFRVCRV